MQDKYNKKIIENNDKYVIYYSKWCGYSMDAIKLLKKKNKTFKAYDIDDIKGGLEVLLKKLRNNSDITNFNKKHHTRPIIFNKGKYIGGFIELKKSLL